MALNDINVKKDRMTLNGVPVLQFGPDDVANHEFDEAAWATTVSADGTLTERSRTNNELATVTTTLAQTSISIALFEGFIALDKSLGTGKFLYSYTWANGDRVTSISAYFEQSAAMGSGKEAKPREYTIKLPDAVFVASGGGIPIATPV